jgi:hypothetical protein
MAAFPCTNALLTQHPAPVGLLFETKRSKLNGGLICIFLDGACIF